MFKQLPLERRYRSVKELSFFINSFMNNYQYSYKGNGYWGGPSVFIFHRAVALSPRKMHVLPFLKYLNT